MARNIQRSLFGNLVGLDYRNNLLVKGAPEGGIEIQGNLHTSLAASEQSTITASEYIASGDAAGLNAALDEACYRWRGRRSEQIIQLPDGVYDYTKSIVINPPDIGRIVIKGGGLTSLASPSAVSISGSTGAWDVTFTCASHGLTTSDYVRIKTLSGTGGYRQLLGSWPVTAVPTANSFTVRNTSKNASITATVSSGDIRKYRTVLRWTGSDIRSIDPNTGAVDVYNIDEPGALEIRTLCEIELQNICLAWAGTELGTSADPHGIMLRYQSKLFAWIGVGIHGFSENGVWLLNNSFARLTNICISGCGLQGIATHLGSGVEGSGCVLTGNTQGARARSQTGQLYLPGATIAGNTDGVSGEDGSKVSVPSCNIVYNAQDGVTLSNGCIGTLLSSANITDNGRYGVRMDNGCQGLAVSATFGGATADTKIDNTSYLHTSGVTYVNGTQSVTSIVTGSSDNIGTNTVTDVLIAQRATTGTPAAGIGAGIRFEVEDLGGVEEQASIDAVLASVTDGAEDVNLDFKMNVDGTITRMLRIVADETGSGGAKLVQVGDDANQVSLELHPPTTARGTLRFTAGNNSGDTVTTIQNSAQAGTRAYNIPDAGTNADFVMTQGAQTIAGAKTFTGSIIRTGQKRIYNVQAKVGSTAGWVLGGGAVDTGLMATLPASQTSSTLVVPIGNLRSGETITAFHLVGQIESGGSTASIDANLMRHSAAAADVSNSSVGAMTTLSVTADTLMNSSNTEKSGLSQVVSENDTFYVLITATTALATDIALQGVAVTITTA